MFLQGLTVLPEPVAAQTKAAAKAETAALELTLPPRVYAVAGDELSLYYDNIVLTEAPKDYQFTVDCPVGEPKEDRWTMTPSPEQVGEHSLRVTVADADGRRIATAETILQVAPADAGADRKLTLLIVGDSLTHATVYPNEIARLLSRPGNPDWTMLGTHRPPAAAEGVAHEGYGGWTWQRFRTHYEPDPDPANRKHSSPFVFLGDDEKPQLDAARYFDERCDGRRPDVVLIMLGINDCFSADPESREAIDARIDAVFEHADALHAEFRRAAPDADLGICLTTPPNARESGFEANYRGRYHRWGWKRIQHRLVQRELQHFAGREQERIFIVPTELNLDPWAGYPENNGVHPNAVGYRQVGASMYAWLKNRAAAFPQQAGNE